MREQRGVTLVEVLVTSLAAGIIFLALSFVYEATSRTFADSDSQMALQRQGTLALHEIGQQVRSGVAITTGACRGHAGSVQVTIPVSPELPTGTVCYYAGSSGQLWQAMGTTGAECTDPTCWNLLSAKRQPGPPGSTPVSLWIQPTPQDPRCPAGVPPGGFCFVMAPDPPDPPGPATTQLTLSFAVTDGINVMPFTISLSCKGRNC